MPNIRHIVITLDDAKAIAQTLKASKSRSGVIARIVDRFTAEEGADMVDLVEVLKELPICAACAIEGQASHCSALEGQKQGRRLRRLLDRALP